MLYAVALALVAAMPYSGVGLDNLNDEPILTRAGQQVTVRLTPPPLRPELAGQHPRLLIRAADIPRLRARLADPLVQRYYAPAEPLARKPPAYKAGQRNGGGFRSLGNYALSQLLSPKPEKLAGIITWLEAATTYPDVGVDLDAEYFSEGLALTYDWLYDQLPADLRQRVRDTLSRQGRTVYQASLKHRQGGGRNYQQNHYWFANLSLTLCAAALCGEVPETEQWLAWSWDRLERVALSFSPEGSFHEGTGYWDFSMPALYLWIDLYESLTGQHLADIDTGLRGQAQFRCQHLYPGFELTAPLEDAHRGHGRPPVRLLLWEAKRFGDPLTQGLAELLNRGPSPDALTLLALDERLKATGPLPQLPLARWYRDVETAFARTSWEPGATYAAFVSRPLGGHKYAELCDRYSLGGTGHNHPEANHFVLFGRGEALVDEPGYTYEKRTRNHNTVLVDGQGQFGDGEMWPTPKPGRAHLTAFATDGDLTIMTGDATSAYAPALGLKEFKRTLVLAGRDLVVICDRLRSSSPRTFSWLLHHYGEGVRRGAGWRITRGKAQLDVVPLQPAELTSEQTRYRPKFIHPTRDLTPKEADINLIELKTGPVSEATFLVALQLADAGAEPVAVQDVSNGSCWAVRAGDTVVAFGRGDGPIEVTRPRGAAYRSAAETVVLRGTTALQAGEER